MTIIRSAVLNLSRTAPRKFPTRFSSSISFSSAPVQQMTTSDPTKSHFLVYAPDHADPETFQRRLNARSEHLGRAKTFLTDGVFKVLGPTLTLDSALPGTEPKMNGSMFIAEVSSIEEVKKIVESDAYYKSNVWDKEKILITPMILTAPT